MQRKTIYKWVVTAWFILWGSMLSVTYGQTYLTDHPVTSPTYQFKSTSAYTFGVNSAYTPNISEPFAAGAAKSGKRKSLGDPDDDGSGGQGIGNIPDPLPVGEPLVLLALAALYILRSFRLTKQRE